MKKQMIRILCLLLICVTAFGSVACAFAPASRLPQGTTDGGTTGGTTDGGTTSTTSSQTTTTTGTQPVTPPAGETTTPTTTSSNGGSEPNPDAPTTVMLPEQEVKVIGINLLCNAGTVQYRAPSMIELLKTYDADSIGVQECMGTWEQYLEQGLGDKYGRVGVDCLGNHNARSFATYVYYLKDKYVPIDTGTFWMSKTPETPSRYDDTVDMNRTTTWVILENIETGFRYVHMNLHIDHMNLDVNKIQCQMILQQILRFEAMGYPVFSTGDYNMRETTNSYKVMCSSTKVSDARYIAKDSTTEITHPGVGANIDYCFVTKQYMTVKEFKIVDTHATGTELSDHRGTYTRALVKSLPMQETANTIPNFERGTKLETEGVGSATVAVTFPQAYDATGNVAHSYLVEIMDANGKILKTETISAGYYCPEQAESFRYAFTFPSVTASYLIRVTPISVFGQRGASMVSWLKLVSQEVTPQAAGKPDLLDLVIVNNNGVNEVKDQSAKGYTYETLGDLSVGAAYFAFSNSGNLKIPAFIENNDLLKDGFSISAVIRTGSDVTSEQTIIGNCHAGGYGLQMKNGELMLQVFVNGAYVKASASVAKNNEYNVVGVYDPAQGVMLYVNGELVGLSLVGNDPVMGFATENGAKYLCIGADSDASGKGEYFFKGMIKSVGIYSTALTAGNVLYLYQNR